MEKESESHIQKVLRFQYQRSPRYIVENLFVFPWESDFLVKTTSGYWYEVEIKISFSDFKNDAKNKKEKFEILESGGYHDHGDFYESQLRPNYFSYCVTEDMVEKVLPLLPPYAGLYYVEKKRNRLVKVRLPQKIHKEKVSDDALKLTEKFYYNYRSWKRTCEDWAGERETLKTQIKLLKEEYKAATGADIEDVL